MNRELTNARLVPKQAIVVHHNKSKSDWYLESREIVLKNGRYNFLAPVPLSEEVLQDLAKHYSKTTGTDMVFGGLIDEHLLYAVNRPGQNVVMWYRPAMIRKLNFDSALRIKGNSAVFVPATLHCVWNKNLYVFALMTDERPTKKTKLYKAPFFNIYEDGRVCLGTARIGKVKARTYELEAERFEKAFYMAEQNGGADRNVCKTALALLWTRLINQKRKAFPAKQELVQHPKHKTLGDFIDKLINKNHGKDEEDYDLEEDFYDFEEDFEDEENEIEI